MNELLRRANELIEARERRTSCMWTARQYQDEFCHLATLHAANIIRGYQALLRCMVKLLDHGAFYDATTVSNLEFAIEGEEHVNQLLMAIVKAKAALPKE